MSEPTFTDIELSEDISARLDAIAGAPDEAAAVLSAAGIGVGELLELMRELPRTERQELVDQLCGADPDANAENKAREWGYVRRELSALGLGLDSVLRICGELVTSSVMPSTEISSRSVFQNAARLARTSHHTRFNLFLIIRRLMRLADAPRINANCLVEAFAPQDGAFAELERTITTHENAIAPGAETLVLLVPKSLTPASLDELARRVADALPANDVQVIAPVQRGYGVTFWLSLDVWLPVVEQDEAIATSVIPILRAWMQEMHTNDPRRPKGLSVYNKIGFRIFGLTWKAGSDAPPDSQTDLAGPARRPDPTESYEPERS